LALAADDPADFVTGADLKSNSVWQIFLAGNGSGSDDPNFTGAKAAFQNKGILPNNP